MKNIPEFLIEMLQKQYGKELTDKIIEGYSIDRYVTLRVNTIKTSLNKVKDELDKIGIEYDVVSYLPYGLIIKNATEKVLEELDIYKNGEIYLQSLSSMLPPLVLDPKQDEDILDMAAAPGGKTTQIAAITENKAHITACELNAIRIERLKYNIDKQGASSVYVMKEDARNINDYFSFDRILLDAPCSGSGTLNINDSNLEKTFTIKLIEKSSKTQLELLKKAIKILKPGCELIYSTCSILDRENEDVVEAALKKANARVVPIEFDGIEALPLLPTKIDGTLCIMPNKLYEGFFIAKIRKDK